MEFATYYFLSGILNGITSFVLGLFVLLQHKERRVNQAYFIFNLTITLWSIGYIFWPISKTKESIFLWFRVFHYGALFIPVAYYQFVCVFLNQLQARKRSIAIGYIFAIILSLFVHTHWFIRDMIPKFSFPYWGEPGILHPIFIAYFHYYAAMALLLLWKSLRSLNGVQRSQAKFVFLGTLIGFAGGSTNFPLWYNIPIYPIGNILVTIYVAMIGYAIVRHQLMDIEVIVKRTLVFAGLAGSMVAVVSLTTFVSQDLLARYVAVPRFVANLFSAAIIAAIYGRLRSWLVEVTERYLFQKKYDYKELLRKFTDEVMVIVDLKQLVQMTINTLTETVKLQNCTLLLVNRDNHAYEMATSKGGNAVQLVLQEDEPLITFLRETHEPIVKGGKVRFPEPIIERLQQLKAELCLPLNLHEDLIGVLCLGKKKSDEDFTKDDLDILLPLARTLAIAISNARLFDELAKTQAEAAQREKLAVIGTLSAGINHEICNPLGIVKTQSEAFLLDLQDGLLKDLSPDKMLERVSAILSGTLKQIDRATAITQKLSNFAKPIKEAAAQPVAVDHEVDEVISLVGHDLKLERIEVLKDIPQDLPPIIVDRRQLQEVLFNLIRNAGQAIKPPGCITVRARMHRGEVVRIEIEDTGAGIPPDKLGKIYDPFFTTKEPGKGTGLGLFIVRQIVERNKGRISVESTVGQGTTFFLEFPPAQPVAAGARTS